MNFGPRASDRQFSRVVVSTPASGAASALRSKGDNVIAMEFLSCPFSGNRRNYKAKQRYLARDQNIIWALDPRRLLSPRPVWQRSKPGCPTAAELLRGKQFL